jgi:hypothetical protein
VKVRARRKRVRIIRRRTYWFSGIVFALVWVVIFAQLASGHDPALSRKHRRQATVADRRGASRHASRPVRARRDVRSRRPRHHHHHAAAAVSSASTQSQSSQATPTQAPAPTPAPAPAPQPAPVVTSQS